MHLRTLILGMLLLCSSVTPVFPLTMSLLPMSGKLVVGNRDVSSTIFVNLIDESERHIAFTTRAELHGFKVAFVSALNAWSDGDRCGTFLALSDTAVQVEGSGLQIEAKVLHQQWRCITRQAPSIKGLKVEVETNVIGRTLVSRSSNKFCLRFSPALRDGVVTFEASDACGGCGGSQCAGAAHTNIVGRRGFGYFRFSCD
jgi:hypothetical protein